MERKLASIASIAAQLVGGRFARDGLALPERTGETVQVDAAAAAGASRRRASASAATAPALPAQQTHRIATCPAAPNDGVVRILEVKTATLPENPCLTEAIDDTDGESMQYLRFVSRTGIDAVIPQQRGSLPQAALLVMLPHLCEVQKEWNGARRLLWSMLAHVSHVHGHSHWTVPEEFYLLGYPLGDSTSGEPTINLVGKLLDSMESILDLSAFDDLFWGGQAAVHKIGVEELKEKARRMFSGTGFGSFVGVLATETTVPDLEETLQKSCVARKGHEALNEMSAMSSSSSEDVNSSDGGALCKNGLLDVAGALAAEWWDESVTGKIGVISHATPGRDAAMVLIPLPEVELKWKRCAWHAILLEHLARAMGLPMRVSASTRALCFTAAYGESTAVLAARVGSLLRGLREKVVPEQMLRAVQTWVDSYCSTEVVGGASVSQRQDAKLLALFTEVPTAVPVVPTVDELSKFVAELPIKRAVFLARSKGSQWTDLQDLDYLPSGPEGLSSITSSEYASDADLSNIVCSTEERGSHDFDSSSDSEDSSDTRVVCELPENETVVMPGVVADKTTFRRVPEKFKLLLRNGSNSEPLQVNYGGQALVRERIPPGIPVPTVVPVPKVAGGEGDTVVQIDGQPYAPVELRVYATLPTLQANALLTRPQQAAVRLLLTRLIIAAAKKARRHFLLPHLTKIDAYSVGRFTSRATAGRRNRIVFELRGQSNTIDFVIRSVLQDLENLSSLPSEELEEARAAAVAQLSTATDSEDSDSDYTLADVLSVDGAQVGAVRRELRNLKLEDFRRLAARNLAGGCMLFNDALFEFEFRGYPTVALEMINLFRTRARWNTRTYSKAEMDALAAFQIADLVKLGQNRSPGERKVVCCVKNGSMNTKLAVGGKLPAESGENAKSGIELVKVCLQGLMAKANLRAPSVEAVRFCDTVVFVISAYKAPLETLDKVINQLRRINFRRRIVGRNNSDMLEHCWPTGQRIQAARVADRLKWTIGNESLRLGFCGKTEAEPDGWASCGPNLTETFAQVPVVVDDSPPVLRNFI